MKEYDLSGFACPLSNMKASKLISDLGKGETIRIILGDIETVKGVVQDLKAKGLMPDLKERGENRFVLTITR